MTQGRRTKAGSLAMLLFAMVFAGLAAPVSTADAGCDPYPVGRCGAFNREAVVFCYVLQAGRYAPATDPHVVTLGGAPPDGLVTVDQVERGVAYLRLGPHEAFLADPTHAPLPFRTLFLESNQVAGLQPAPFQCGTFYWFTEFEPAQWMGPFNVVSRDPDQGPF